MKKTIWLSWSSGKDSAWSLYQLQQLVEHDVTGIFTTLNAKQNRVAMHGTRLEILKKQSELLRLPLYLIEIPEPCSNAIYEEKMKAFVAKAVTQNVTHMAFGDLFLEDIRDYRIQNLKYSSIQTLFPLWRRPTNELAHTMVAKGLKAIITCVDTKQLSENFLGREFNQAFLNDLPEQVDPCGENGEFHTCVYAGPFFSKPLDLKLGHTHKSGQFCFMDVTGECSVRPG